jgi:hypothetical protein
MMGNILENAEDLTLDDYLVIGLATCFFRDDEGVHEIKVIEPIPSSALEALMKGIPTSYELAYGTKLGELFKNGTVEISAEFPADAQLGDDFELRSLSASRTYKRRPQAQLHIPLGTVYRDFKYSTERKRVLNAARVVTKDDNVKQHAYTHQKL